ncbi:hypothetical protein FRC17_001537, partial [Serendipita sp. 399]
HASHRALLPASAIDLLYQYREDLQVVIRRQETAQAAAILANFQIDDLNWNEDEGAVGNCVSHLHDCRHWPVVANTLKVKLNELLLDLLREKAGLKKMLEVEGDIGCRPSLLRGRQEVPEPPSIAARRRNSNAAPVQLQTQVLDPKTRSYAAYIAQTPSPKQAYAPAKNNDYFRNAHGSGTSSFVTSPHTSMSGSSAQTHQRHRSSYYGQPPTPGVTQHVPAWNIQEQRARNGSISEKPVAGDAADDPLHILDTLPIQNLRLNSSAPAPDSRCGTLKRPMAVGEDRRTTARPTDVVLNPNTSTIANRRNVMVGSHHSTMASVGLGDQSRQLAALRPVEPDSTT